MATSSLSRIVSGSAASWGQIGINLIAQLAITPFFLSNWSTKEYGLWLTFLATTGFLQILDTGHQAYLGNKFLITGREKKGEIENILSSAIPIAGISALCQVLITIFITNSNWINQIAPDTIDGTSIKSLKILLISQALIWGLTGSIGGLMVRSLSPFGYYSRFAWWQTLLQAIITILPVFSVIAGGKLLECGITMLAGTLFINILLLIDIKRIYKVEGISFRKPDIKAGFLNFRYSLMLTSKAMSEMFRQQGVRLILSPLGGVSEMAAFATMRTGANVAMQGLATITNPLMPELIRFLSQRDQDRSESAFGTVWIIVVALMAPGVVLLQAFIQPLFFTWTRGHIIFNPLLFSILSINVLIYAVAQPAIGIVNGNNLLRPQLILSSLAALIVLGGMYILVPKIGILGAGISLLVAEITATTGYKLVAKKWLAQNGLSWPVRPSRIAVSSVWFAAIAMLVMIYFPSLKWSTIIVSMIVLYWNLWKYWNSLPALAIQRIKKIFITIPGAKRLFAV